LVLEAGRGATGDAVSCLDVHADELTMDPGGDTRRSAQELLTTRGASERDDHALLGLPGLSDSVPLPVGAEVLVDPIRDPQQRELAQRGQVADSEVVGERRVHLLGRVDVAVRHSAAQRLGTHVHELQLVGGAHDGVGHRLALGDAGDVLHDVVEPDEVLDVDGGDDVDACVEQLVDVLPAFLVAAAGDVGVRELVDEGLRGAAFEDGVDVHLLKHLVPVGQLLAGDDFEVADLGRRLRSAMRLDVADDDIRAPAFAPPAFVEHREGLADARGGPHIDA
jgi:hypothetical protein